MIVNSSAGEAKEGESGQVQGQHGLQSKIMSLRIKKGE